jgi:phosphomannomutase
MIRFGTDGWRAVIGEGFTLENVRRIGRAVAGYLRENEGRLPGRTDRVVIGHDTRGLGAEASLALAEVLGGCGIRATLARGIVPTPAVSLGVKDRGLALGLMVTASHNPARFNGVKLKAHYGGSALPEIYEAVARKIDAAVPMPASSGSMDEADLLSPYLDYLAGSIDAALIRRADLFVGWDPMHGATCAAFPALAERLGLRFDMPFGTPEASFGGRDPEPIPRNLEPTREHVRGRSFDAVGIADGDGDRLGMLLSDGAFVSPHHILSLLSLYVLEVKGWRKGIARTFSSSFWLDRIAREFGVPFYETGIGFKYLCPLLLEGKVSIAGEESGGVAFAPTLPERDALLTFFMVLEMLAHRGRTLAECLSDLARRFGELCYDRLDLKFPVDQGRALTERLFRRPPAEVAGRRVTEARDTDGVKFLFGEEGWLLFRASGTEPLLRIYSEMPSREAVAEVLEEAQRLARRERTA